MQTFNAGGATSSHSARIAIMGNHQSHKQEDIIQGDEATNSVSA